MHRCEVSLSQVKEIPRWCMTIIVGSCRLSDMSERIEAIARKNNMIVFSEYPCLREKSPLEYEMAPSFRIHRFSERDNPACESERTRIEAPFWEKSRDEISMEGLCHERDESFSSSAIEERIMENSNFHMCESYWKGGIWCKNCVSSLGWFESSIWVRKYRYISLPRGKNRWYS